MSLYVSRFVDEGSSFSSFRRLLLHQDVAVCGRGDTLWEIGREDILVGSALDGHYVDEEDNDDVGGDKGVLVLIQFVWSESDRQFVNCNRCYWKQYFWFWLSDHGEKQIKVIVLVTI